MFLYFVLGSIPIWLPRETIQQLMPECFKALYPRIRVVIDCTELKIQQPSSVVLNSQSYSHYKGTNTFKCLPEIAPHGGVTLNIPEFLSSKRQFTISEIEHTEQVAKLRIHIERMNRRIKENHLFDTQIPLSLAGSINQQGQSHVY